MSGKMKEMASRYLGYTEMPIVSQITTKPNVQSLSTTGDENACHSVTGLTERQRDAEWKSNVEGGFGNFSFYYFT